MVLPGALSDDGKISKEVGAMPGREGDRLAGRLYLHGEEDHHHIAFMLYNRMFSELLQAWFLCLYE